MLTREQNLKYAEVTLFTRLIQQGLELLVELATDADKIKQRKVLLRTDVNVLLKYFEAELYQDRYLPEYQRAEREERRSEAILAAEKKAREAIALKRVAAFSNEDTPR